MNNLSFAKELYVSKDSLTNGIQLFASDSSYKIISFLLTHDSKERDIPEKIIFGNQVNQMDFPVLASLKRGEMLVFSYLKIERTGKLFTVPDFVIIITN